MKRLLIYVCCLIIPSVLCALEYICGYGRSEVEALQDLSMNCINVASHQAVSIRNGKSSYDNLVTVDSGITFPKSAVEYSWNDDICEARVPADLVRPTASNWEFYEEKSVHYGPQHLVNTNNGVRRITGTKRVVTQRKMRNARGETIILDRRVREYKEIDVWNPRGYGYTGSIRKRR